MTVSAGASPALSIRRKHKHRESNTKDSDHQTLVTDAHKMLEASGAYKSPSWVSRAVRDFERSPRNGMPFDKFLANRLQGDVKRRATADTKRQDRRRESIKGFDPTANDAISNVESERGY